MYRRGGLGDCFILICAGLREIKGFGRIMGLREIKGFGRIMGLRETKQR